MLTFVKSLRMIRYLIVWKINSPFCILPNNFPVELSYVLASFIAKRLSTMEAASWQKMLKAWKEASDKIPTKRNVYIHPIEQVSWPIEMSLFVYPSKHNYGKGELILMELKLLGNSAEHGLFLELIVPAMEEAGFTSDSAWHSHNRIWGRFDIHAAYVAHGPRWVPLVTEGRIDLRYQPSAVQWCDGWDFAPPRNRKPNGIVWLTPFDLQSEPSRSRDAATNEDAKEPESQIAPTLYDILQGLLQRVGQLLSPKGKAMQDVWDFINDEDRLLLESAMQKTSGVPVLWHTLKPVPASWPGRWVGKQGFPTIPPPVIPYLDLASMLHIGRQTHFGCGTFLLARIRKT